MSASLSGGALLTICQGGKVDKPVLQVLGYKKIAGSSNDRYRVFISDGQYSNSFSMLGTQMNDKIHAGQLENYTLVRANNYICNNIQDKRVIILLEVEVLQPGKEVGRKIGDPVQINADGTVSSKPASASSAPAAKRPASDSAAQQPQAKRSPLTTPNAKAPRSSILDPRPVSSSAPSASGFDPSNMNVFPIASLTPYQNKWTIKARVTHKSDIRRWSNSRGEGHLFSMDLLDESGEIRATAFKEMCDKYYNMIEVGKVYYITSCSMKAANKQYSTLKNEYEMTFRDSTEVFPCEDAVSSIPCLSYDFVQISDMANVAKDTLVDIMGVCRSASDVATIVSQRTQKELTKRDVVLVDKSMSDVNLTLWGGTAESFDPTGNPVVVVKGAKVSDYNGVSLSAMGTSVIQINPDLPQAHSLKGWFDSEGSSANITSLTQQGARGGAGGDIGVGSNLKTIGDVKRDQLGLNTPDGKPEYYSSQGYIVMFQKDKALYQACNRVNDGKQCNKKVLDQNNGYYRCEKCNVENDNFNWRIVLSFSIADATDNQWVTCFQEQAEQILGMSAQELGTLSQQDPDQYNKVFQESTFKRYNFRLSCKAEHYNDEDRVRHTVRTVVDLDWNDHYKRMIKDLDEAGCDLPSKIIREKFGL